MSTPRNAPCPCNSGKKFKRCCGATGAENDAGDEAESAVEPPNNGRRIGVPLALVSGAVGLGVAVGTLRGEVADGLAVTLALTMGIIIYLMARNPPEGTGTEGGSAINFGLDRRGRSRGNRTQNRRQRRRK